MRVPNRQTRRTGIRLLAVGAALALILAACGGDDDDDDAAASATTTTTAAESESTHHDQRDPAARTRPQRSRSPRPISATSSSTNRQDPLHLRERHGRRREHVQRPVRDDVAALDGDRRHRARRRTRRLDVHDVPARRRRDAGVGERPPALHLRRGHEARRHQRPRSRRHLVRGRRQRPEDRRDWHSRGREQLEFGRLGLLGEVEGVGGPAQSRVGALDRVSMVGSAPQWGRPGGRVEFAAAPPSLCFRARSGRRTDGARRSEPPRPPSPSGGRWLVSLRGSSASGSWPKPKRDPASPAAHHRETHSPSAPVALTRPRCRCATSQAASPSVQREPPAASPTPPLLHRRHRAA